MLKISWASFKRNITNDNFDYQLFSIYQYKIQTPL